MRVNTLAMRAHCLMCAFSLRHGAGKPFFAWDYQFINREQVTSIDVAEIALKFAASGAGDVRCATGEGYYQTTITEGANARLLDAEMIVFQSVEHVLDTFYGDFWADWCDAEKGVCITPFQAHQNFPKGIAVGEDGIGLDIYPASQDPVKVLQGVAKTHRMQFYFHTSAVSLDDVVVQSAPISISGISVFCPSRGIAKPMCGRISFPRNKNWDIEASIINMADGRNQGLGMMHWGDGPGSRVHAAGARQRGIGVDE